MQKCKALTQTFTLCLTRSALENLNELPLRMSELVPPSPRHTHMSFKVLLQASKLQEIRLKTRLLSGLNQVFSVLKSHFINAQSSVDAIASGFFEL